MICILNTSKTGPIKQGDNIDIKEKVWIIAFVFVLAEKRDGVLGKELLCILYCM
jgi:hypothetical protein